MAKFGRKEIREIIGEGCTDEMENRLVALHLSVTDPMKDDIAKYKAQAEQLETVQKELDGLKAKGDYKDRYEAEHKAFEDYKNAQAQKETQAAKEKAAKTFFEGKGITGTNLDIALKGAKDEIAALELEDGKIKDNKALADLVSGTYAGLVVTQRKQGANPATPPANNGGTLKSREDIYKRDDKGRFLMDSTQRQEALAKLIADEQQKG